MPTAQSLSHLCALKGKGRGWAVRTFLINKCMHACTNGAGLSHLCIQVYMRSGRALPVNKHLCAPPGAKSDAHVGQAEKYTYINPSVPRSNKYTCSTQYLRDTESGSSEGSLEKGCSCAASLNTRFLPKMHKGIGSCTIPSANRQDTGTPSSTIPESDAFAQSDGFMYDSLH